MQQILLATNYMHHQKLVHRDLKPENILIVPEEGGDPDKVIVKVTDFGFACHFHESEGMH